MQQPQQNTPNMFVDSIICGAIGGGIAWTLGRHLYLWAMLSAIVGPLFILFASLLVEAMPEDLPGKYSGTYEFAIFAAAVAILALIDPFPA